ncbi:MAG: hypothetical protein K1X68_00135 [Saprospiraceae bacterium]|mgnify:CR=1 FL=1|nr:hypothetical protein [Saprospiraceae bacterium]HMW39657.1 hypothetical protein [Saprospiraceae bacterium]HMX88332.1 hypothetical protein [Saprospiraceae bacterium]HMZ40384.1 hypothetical protein [Saprospiraceae bacterium]HNA65147.1 hypothetical protein [Saprospiraceae bacterium]
MRLIIIFSAFMAGYSCLAQTLAVNTAISYGSYYDIKNVDGQYEKKYQPQIGYRMGLEINNIPNNSPIHTSLCLYYQSYGGSFYTKLRGLGGTIYDDGQITKNVMGIDFAPIGIQFLRHFTLSCGLSFNVTLLYQISGIHSWFVGGTPPRNGTVQLKDLHQFVNRFNFGAFGTLGYRFEFGKLVLEPRYSYDVGLSEEFNHLQADTKSKKQLLTISLGYKIGKNAKKGL